MWAGVLLLGSRVGREGLGQFAETSEDEDGERLRKCRVESEPHLVTTTLVTADG
jgi:hypothetical protein